MNLFLPGLGVRASGNGLNEVRTLIEYVLDLCDHGGILVFNVSWLVVHHQLSPTIESGGLTWP